MNVYRPSRQYRRMFSGRPCPACGLRVDWKDLAAVVADGATYYLHEACVEIVTSTLAAETDGA